MGHVVVDEVLKEAGKLLETAFLLEMQEGRDAGELVRR